LARIDTQGISADHLDDFQAEFSFLLGASFADPDHVAALGTGCVFTEDEFDHLAMPKRETSPQAEIFIMSF
jgi:hypothetical protein